MAIAKICDVCNASGAETVMVSLSAVNNFGDPVGTAQSMDLCPLHRAEGIALMNTKVQADIEAAILAV